MKSRGVIHRDIKCANVLVSNGPILKLGDFGLSKVYSIDQSSRGTTMVGTPLYVAPEIAMGQYSSAVDMFSMGTLFFRFSNVIESVLSTRLGKGAVRGLAVSDLVFPSATSRW